MIDVEGTDPAAIERKADAVASLGAIGPHRRFEVAPGCRVGAAREPVGRPTLEWRLGWFSVLAGDPFPNHPPRLIDERIERWRKD